MKTMRFLKLIIASFILASINLSPMAMAQQHDPQRENIEDQKYNISEPIFPSQQEEQEFMEKLHEQRRYLLSGQ